MNAERTGGRQAHGFSLIEVVVSLAILAVALLALGDGVRLGQRAVASSRATAIATMAAFQKIEQIGSLVFAFDTAGAPVTDASSDLSDWPRQAAGGHGLSPSASSSLATNVPGFVDYLDAGGEWLGNGATPPWRSAFIRRWSIADDPALPGQAILVSVVVLRRAVGSVWPWSDPRSWVTVLRVDSARCRGPA